MANVSIRVTDDTGPSGTQVQIDVDRVAVKAWGGQELGRPDVASALQEAVTRTCRALQLTPPRWDADAQPAPLGPPPDPPQKPQTPI